LQAQLNRSDLSDLPPLSDTYLLKLKRVVNAHNIFVQLDPHLARCDQARLGPDDEASFVDIQEGRTVVRSAVVEQAATPSAERALFEESKVAGVSERTLRRYSEGIRNFARAMAVAATSTLRYVGQHWKVVGGAIVAAPTASLAVVKWMVANEKWFIETFSNNPYMLRVLEDLFELIKRLPLL
jgi:hypothetical protein